MKQLINPSIYIVFLMNSEKLVSSLLCTQKTINLILKRFTACQKNWPVSVYKESPTRPEHLSLGTHGNY